MPVPKRRRPMRTRSDRRSKLLALSGCAHATGSVPREGPQPFGVAVHRENRGKWSLVWSDEFDGAAGALPDSAKWTYDAGGDGWGNAELETYCAPGSSAPCDYAAPNAYQDGRGHLVISARKDAAGRWTSARGSKPSGLKTFEYGRVEASMRLLPPAPKPGPAFWMLGSGHPVGRLGRPAGEIDIMENVPGDVPGGLGLDAIKSTVHGPGYSWRRRVRPGRATP